LTSKCKGKEAEDLTGATIDFLLSTKQDAAAAANGAFRKPYRGHAQSHQMTGEK
jgi:hypothetical protein